MERLVVAPSPYLPIWMLCVYYWTVEMCWHLTYKFQSSRKVTAKRGKEWKESVSVKSVSKAIAIIKCGANHLMHACNTNPSHVHRFISKVYERVCECVRWKVYKRFQQETAWTRDEYGKATNQPTNAYLHSTYFSAHNNSNNSHRHALRFQIEVTSVIPIL